MEQYILALKWKAGMAANQGISQVHGCKDKRLNKDCCLFDRLCGSIF